MHKTSTIGSVRICSYNLYLWVRFSALKDPTHSPVLFRRCSLGRLLRALPFAGNTQRHEPRSGSLGYHRHLVPPRLKDFPYFPPRLARAILLLVLNLDFWTCSRSAAHGMGYPSARRDRSELRDQLVRQRRTIVPTASLSSGRFLKRTFLYSPFSTCVTPFLGPSHCRAR